jgi:hypothetical protein
MNERASSALPFMLLLLLLICSVTKRSIPAYDNWMPDSLTCPNPLELLPLLVSCYAKSPIEFMFHSPVKQLEVRRSYTERLVELISTNAPF